MTRRIINFTDKKTVVEIKSMLNEQTLMLLSREADIDIVFISEATINNANNPLLDGVYRYEIVSYIDLYGAEQHEQFLYKNSRLIPTDGRDVWLKMAICNDAEFDLYNDKRIVYCSEDDRDYYICSLLLNKRILNNKSIRDYCTVKEIC